MQKTNDNTVSATIANIYRPHEPESPANTAVIGGNGGPHGRRLAHGKHGRRAGTSGETDTGTQKQAERVENAGYFLALRGGRQIDVLDGPMVDSHEGNGVFGSSEG